MSGPDDYYVYVYIDPRNFEEFYYGKGKGLRKNAHLRKLKDLEESKKSQRINQIREEGLEPLVRVIAKDLTAREALLIEKTLLWKLGKYTTNVATGHFSKNFRPENTLFKRVPGFDYSNGIYYYNLGGYSPDVWAECRKYGFIIAGGGPRYRDAITKFNGGDLIVAYLSNRGFVGVGRIQSAAQLVTDAVIKGTPFMSLEFQTEQFLSNIHDPEFGDYVCQVKWIKSVPGENAKWAPNSKLFTNPTVRASLEGKKRTLSFIEQSFGIKLSKYLK